MIAGTYVAWYGVYELRVHAGGTVDDPAVDAAAMIQERLADWVDDLERFVFAFAFVMLTLTAVGLRAFGKRKSRNSHQEERDSRPLTSASSPAAWRSTHPPAATARLGPALPCVSQRLSSTRPSRRTPLAGASRPGQAGDDQQQPDPNEQAGPAVSAPQGLA